MESRTKTQFTLYHKHTVNSWAAGWLPHTERAAICANILGVIYDRNCPPRRPLYFCFQVYSPSLYNTLCFSPVLSLLPVSLKPMIFNNWDSCFLVLRLYYIAPGFTNLYLLWGLARPLNGEMENERTAYRGGLVGFCADRGVER